MCSDHLSSNPDVDIASVNLCLFWQGSEESSVSDRVCGLFCCLFLKKSLSFFPSNMLFPILVLA